MTRGLERKDITKEYLVKLYDSFDEEITRDIEFETDQNLSSEYVYTEEPTPMSWDYPGDDGKGYFTGYEWYIGNMFQIIVEWLYYDARTKDEYKYDIDYFKNDVIRALFIDTNTNIYEIFPDLLTEEEYQEECWEANGDDRWIKE